MVCRAPTDGGVLAFCGAVRVLGSLLQLCELRLEPWWTGPLLGRALRAYLHHRRHGRGLRR